MKKVIIAMDVTHNRKTGVTSATYAPLATCPDTCPLKNNGCYAQNNPLSMHVRKCDNAAAGLTPVEIAREEARAIRALKGTLPLRLHVSGDFKDTESAAIVDAAAGEYTKKHGQPVWTYTHTWRSIPRATFKHIVILASCESLDEVKEAESLGYRAAVILPTGTKTKNVQVCRHTTHGIQCDECRMCMSKRAKKAVGFYPHGSGAKKASAIIEKKGELS